MNNFEKDIVIFFNRFQIKWLDFISEAISNISFLTFLWSLVIVFFMISNFSFGFEIMLKLALVFVVHYIISEGIIKYGSKKFFLPRQRPYVAYPKEIRGIGRNFSDSSFPSSHMSSVTGGLIVIYTAYPDAWPALLIFGLMLAFSRLHNGMHYPSDILAGIILGYGYGWMALFLFSTLQL
jgi:undecaprenyl-diphosphatase